MPRFRQQQQEARERVAERRRREDDAARLGAEVPALSALKVELEELRGGQPIVGSAHVRHILVESAPALFLFPCGDRACRDGGHDVTAALLRALVRGSTQIEGEDACGGAVHGSPCARVLRYVARPTFAPGSGAQAPARRSG
jgi:hypothetical protein